MPSNSAFALVNIESRQDNPVGTCVHSEMLLDPNPGWAFLAVRDLINQLCPPQTA